MNFKINHVCKNQSGDKQTEKRTGFIHAFKLCFKDLQYAIIFKTANLYILSIEFISKITFIYFKEKK